MSKKKVTEVKEVKYHSDGKVRLPRAFGITQLMAPYSKLPEPQQLELLTKVQDYVIQQWFLGNGNLCGLSLSTYALANFLHCEPDRVQLFMRDRVLSAKIWDSSKQKELLEGILGQQLSWVLEDRMEAQSQLDLLKRAQGDTYKAFISGEVNKAIKLKLESSTALQSVFRSIAGGSTVNVFNQLNVQNNGNPAASGVTQAEALAIIDENYSLLALEKGAKLYLEEHYELDELPVVVAGEQSGINTDKEGLKIMRKDIAKVVDNYKANLDGGGNDEDFHDLRREVELSIDEDEEDPEFIDYEDESDED